MKECTLLASVFCIDISTFAMIVMIEKFHDTENFNHMKGNVAHQEGTAHDPGLIIFPSPLKYINASSTTIFTSIYGNCVDVINWFK